MENELKFCGNIKKISDKLLLVDFSLNVLFEQLAEENKDVAIETSKKIFEVIKASKNPIFEVYKGKEKIYYKVKTKIINEHFFAFNDYVPQPQQEAKEMKEQTDDLPF